MAAVPSISLSNNFTRFSQRELTDTVFNRLYVPTKAGAFLAHRNTITGESICEQFAVDPTHVTLRPLVFTSRNGRHLITDSRSPSNEDPQKETEATPLESIDWDRKIAIDRPIPTDNSNPLTTTLEVLMNDAIQPENISDNDIAFFVPTEKALLFSPVVNINSPSRTAIDTARIQSLSIDLPLNRHSPTKASASLTLSTPLQAAPIRDCSPRIYLLSPTPNRKGTESTPTNSPLASRMTLATSNVPDTTSNNDRSMNFSTPSRKKALFMTPSSPLPTAITSPDNSFFTPNKKHKRLDPDIIIQTPGGTEMTSERFVDLTTTDKTDTIESTLFFCSPVRPPIPPRSNPHTRKKSKKSNKTEPTTNTPTPSDLGPLPAVQGGESTTLVLYRRDRKNRKQHPDQIKVAGKNAVKIFEEALQTTLVKHDSERQLLIQSLCAKFKLEWLHCLAFSLAPKDFNPQSMSNLACGGSWINTTMMILEKVANHFATLHPGCIQVKPLFKMIPGTHIIDELEYEVTLRKTVTNDADSEPKVVIKNKMKVLALPERSNWASVSDSIFVRETAKAKLESKLPIHRTSIRAQTQ
jgi:hypothetical protein